MIATQKKNIDIVQTIEAAGTELRKQGNRYVGCCPFHNEMNPSFYVFPEKSRFKCFGCGEGGDVIDFTQKHYGLSFKDSLKHLGIEVGSITPKIKDEIKKRNRLGELVKRFRRWENNTIDDLRVLSRATSKVTGSIKTEADLEKYGDLFHKLTYWEYCRDLLCLGSDKDKFDLFREANHV